MSDDINTLSWHALRERYQRARRRVRVEKRRARELRSLARELQVRYDRREGEIARLQAEVRLLKKANAYLLAAQREDGK